MERMLVQEHGLKAYKRWLSDYRHDDMFLMSYLDAQVWHQGLPRSSRAAPSDIVHIKYERCAATLVKDANISADFT